MFREYCGFIKDYLKLAEIKPLHLVTIILSAFFYKGFSILLPLVGSFIIKYLTEQNPEMSYLSLARTLLSRSEVLLFDEITSTLDLNTSKQIVSILKKLKKDHTILMITHKPELMKLADDIIVIDHGRLVGRGTHKELARKNKYYKLLQK